MEAEVFYVNKKPIQQSAWGILGLAAIMFGLMLLGLFLGWNQTINLILIVFFIPLLIGGIFQFSSTDWPKQPPMRLPKRRYHPERKAEHAAVKVREADTYEEDIEAIRVAVQRSAGPLWNDSTTLR